ncbi:HSP20-like chaperone [Pholiota molesta]|nr:HSP20-like chaperone [Pholiota molesta]
MSVCYYEPFYDFESILDNALSAHLGSNVSNDKAVQRRTRARINGDPTTKILKPRYNGLVENKDKSTVTATFELPGLKKEDVNIDVRNNQLIVSGESSISTNKDEGDYVVRERSYGKFSRTLQLPQGVKEDQIKANLENGVLKVEFPKVPPEQAPKKITIN